jgi:A/G-specific adenine glycosylase
MQHAKPFSSQIQPEHQEKAPAFAARLIKWYQQHQRSLPWRLTRDPYKIWLSEIILQQTRVVQGLPYYQAFVEKYPTVYDLAAAGQSEVLLLWQGLGYYTRARNLHACARKVVEQFQGRFPDNYKTLLTLPGIGSYTAAAIASIAFQEAVPVLDGNVYRLLSRFFALDTPINTGKGKQVFMQLARDLIASATPDVYNQAIMEFGAIQCMPAAPRCDDCILKLDCSAYATDKQMLLPIKLPRLKIRKRFLNYFVILYGTKILMRLRTAGDIWTGLYDFYAVETDKAVELEELSGVLIELIQAHGLSTKKACTYKHILTHQILYASFFVLESSLEFMQTVQCTFDNNLSIFELAQIQSLPKPVLICNFLEKHLYSKNNLASLF